MTSDELRTWLLTEASGEDAFADRPDLDLPELDGPADSAWRRTLMTVGHDPMRA